MRSSKVIRDSLELDSELVEAEGVLKDDVDIGRDDNSCSTSYRWSLDIAENIEAKVIFEKS